MTETRPTTKKLKVSIWLGIIAMCLFVLARLPEKLLPWAVVLFFFACLLAVASALLATFVVFTTPRRRSLGSVASAVMGAVCTATMLISIPSMTSPAACMKSQQNLKHISLAVHNCHFRDGKVLSPIRDRDGKPLLSIRVTILPCLLHDDLYRQFHLDEPWDSLHNLGLLERMPGTYRSPGAPPPQPSMTYYRFITGRRTALERDGLMLADAKDRLTVLMVEAGDAVPWTKPEEWEYDPEKPLPPLGGVFNHGSWFSRLRGHLDGTNVVFVGSGEIFLPRSTPEATWRGLIERDGSKNFEWP
jgi:Protein of unknown function (DUF1559)